MSFLDTRRNRAAFLKAQRAAGEDGRVCGTYSEDGEPLYFVVSRDATDDEVRLRAFEAKHGRPMNHAEELLAMAQSGDLVREAEAAIGRYLGGADALS